MQLADWLDRHMSMIATGTTFCMGFLWGLITSWIA